MRKLPIILIGTLVAVVLLMLFSPIRFDLDIGFRPARTNARGDDARGQQGALPPATKTEVTDDAGQTDDLLTITIDEGTAAPMPSQPASEHLGQ